DETALDGIARNGGDDRDRRGCFLGGASHLLGAGSHDDRDLSANQILHKSVQEIIAAARPAKLHRDVAASYKSHVLKSALASRNPRCEPCRTAIGKKADRRHRRLLRGGGERPCGRSTQQRHELPPPHSITSSAATSMPGGTVNPSTFAV